MMELFFFIAAGIAIISSILTITRDNAIHALLYLILSLLSISVIFFLLGAPFVAALEVIIYAGAIMVLFIFVVMMLNIGQEERIERYKLRPKVWILPSTLSLIILFDLIFIMSEMSEESVTKGVIAPKAVGVSLFTTYLLIVEISAILLLAGIIGAYHLGKQRKNVVHRYLEEVKAENKVFNEEI